jgi:transposase
MKKGIEVRLDPGDRERLEAVIGSRNSPQKHVWRARIVLLSADGVGTMAIQRQTGKGKPTIWRWQARFMTEGVDGLLHDATRPGRKKPLPGTTIERVVAMTLTDPSGEATHWTGRAMAKAAGISLRSVQHLGGARSEAASGPAAQAFQRRRVCRQGSGHRRPLYRPARACAGAVGR